MGIDQERHRLSPVLLPGETPLVAVKSRTFFPASRGVLAVTPTRVVYASKKRSWVSELRHVTAVSLTQERARGTIRITSAEVEVLSSDWSDAQEVFGAIQAGLAAQQ